MDNSSYVTLAKETVKRNLSVDDLIKKLINLIDMGGKSENTLFEAVYDLFFLYFPEAANLSQTKESFAKITANGVGRKEVSGILGIDGGSMGYDFDDDDLQLLSTVVNELGNVHILLDMVGQRLERIMASRYVNLTRVSGYELSARLVSLSGGIKKLAYMPSSRIQVIGSDKSRFSRRSAARGPKYGVIFKHEKVEAADQSRKGRVARIVASKISMAAKLDLFSGEDKSAALIEEMDREIAEIGRHGTAERNR